MSERFVSIPTKVALEVLEAIDQGLQLLERDVGPDGNFLDQIEFTFVHDDTTFRYWYVNVHVISLGCAKNGVGCP
jgi:hypothetical protein